jgi:hypothetical protein
MAEVGPLDGVKIRGQRRRVLRLKFGERLAR